jgi:hypothetical protein
MSEKIKVVRRKTKPVDDKPGPRDMQREVAEFLARKKMAGEESAEARKVRLEPSEYDRDAAARGASQAAPEKLSGVVPPRREYKLIEGIDPVELFMAYHLGVTADDGYQSQNIHDLARRFRTEPGRINEALRAYEMDADTMLNTDFDLAMAQLDIRVAPEGVSKRELGRQLYEEFRSSPRVVRNWADELRHDAEENRKIFEKLK